MKRLFLTALLSLLAVPAMAQEDAMMGLPGYVDFGDLESFYGEPRVSISVGSTLLGFVAAMSRNEDPQVAAIFSKLKGVRVRVFNTGGDNAAAISQLSHVKQSLQAVDWLPVVQVNEEDSHVQIFMKMNGEIMDGMTLMAVDDEEAVFINVIGQLNPQELAEVMNKFDVDLDDAFDVDFD